MPKMVLWKRLDNQLVSYFLCPSDGQGGRTFLANTSETNSANQVRLYKVNYLPFANAGNEVHMYWERSKFRRQSLGWKFDERIWCSKMAAHGGFYRRVN